MKKTLTIAALATLTLTGCSVVNTAPNEQALRYNDPLAGAKTYDSHFGPSKYDMASPFNVDYTYPAGQRTYAFQPEGGDAQPMNPATKDGVTVGVSGAVRFELTNNPEKLREFHERVGLQLKAYEPDGWREFLRIYMNAPINRALNDATQGINWADLYTKPEVKAEWERKVAELLPAYVNQAIGGEYVTNFTVTLQKPVLPNELEQALQSAQVAAQQNRAQEERNAQIKTESESIKELVAILGVDGYNVYQAIKDGRVQVMPVPQGSPVVASK